MPKCSHQEHGETSTTVTPERQQRRDARRP